MVSNVLDLLSEIAGQADDQSDVAGLTTHSVFLSDISDDDLMDIVEEALGAGYIYFDGYGSDARVSFTVSGASYWLMIEEINNY